MRVAIVTEFAYPVLGGVSEHVHFLSRELVALGHEVSVVTGRLDDAFAATDPGDRENEIQHGYRTVRVGHSMRLVSNGSIAHMARGWRLQAQLGRALDGFDVVHAQVPHAPTLPQLAIRASIAPVTVGTFHSYFEGRYVSLVKAFRPWLGNVLRRMDRLIAVSDVTRDLFEPLFPGPWQVIPNGIDADLFRPLRAGERRPEGPPRVLYVGRLEPRNALDTLLEALVLLRREGRDAIVQVVGDGPMRERFQALARALGVDDRVEWLGPRLGDRPRLYREASVFACPCLIASFGVVLLEALASGTPIVATDNIGFRQVIRDGMPASFVPPREPVALARQIGALLDDPARGAEWGRTGRRLAVERYAWPQVAAEVAAVYEEVLHQNGPARRPPVTFGRRYPARPPWRPVEVARAGAPAAPEGAPQ